MSDFDPAQFESFLKALDDKDTQEKAARVKTKAAAAYDRPDIQRDVEPSFMDKLDAHLRGAERGAASMAGWNPDDVAGITRVGMNSQGAGDFLGKGALASMAAGGAGILAGPLAPMVAPMAFQKATQYLDPDSYEQGSTSNRAADDAKMTASPTSAFTENVAPALLGVGMGGLGAARSKPGTGSPVMAPDVTTPAAGRAPTLNLSDLVKEQALHRMPFGTRSVGRAVLNRIAPEGPSGAQPEVPGPISYTKSPTVTNQVVPTADMSPWGMSPANTTEGAPSGLDLARPKPMGSMPQPWSDVGGSYEGTHGPVPDQEMSMEHPAPGGTRDFQAPEGPSGLDTDPPPRKTPQFPADFPNTDPDAYTPEQMALSKKAESLAEGRPRYADPDNQLPDYGQLSTPHEDQASSGFLGLDELQHEFPGDPLSPEAHDYGNMVERLSAGEKDSVADSPRAKLRLASMPDKGGAQVLSLEDLKAQHEADMMRKMPDKSPGQNSYSHTVEAMLRDSPMRQTNSMRFNFEGDPVDENLESSIDQGPGGRSYLTYKPKSLQDLQAEAHMRPYRDRVGVRENNQNAWEGMRGRQGAVSIDFDGPQDFNAQMAEARNGAPATPGQHPATILEVTPYGTSGRSGNVIIRVKDEITGEEHKFVAGHSGVRQVLRDAEPGRPLKDGEELTPYERSHGRKSKAGRGFAYGNARLRPVRAEPTEEE